MVVVENGREYIDQEILVTSPRCCKLLPGG